MKRKGQEAGWLRPERDGEEKEAKRDQLKCTRHKPKKTKSGMVIDVRLG